MSPQRRMVLFAIAHGPEGNNIEASLSSSSGWRGARWAAPQRTRLPAATAFAQAVASSASRDLACEARPRPQVREQTKWHLCYTHCRVPIV